MTQYVEDVCLARSKSIQNHCYANQIKENVKMKQQKLKVIAHFKKEIMDGYDSKKQ